jgi:hypothetical protein
MAKESLADCAEIMMRYPHAYTLSDKTCLVNKIRALESESAGLKRQVASKQNALNIASFNLSNKDGYIEELQAALSASQDQWTHGKNAEQCLRALKGE